jgi:hypothetical protein
LLWALFKPNGHVVTICRGSSKPRCARYDFSEEKEIRQGVKYFELQCRYLDFDGKVFGEVMDRLPIEKFYGAKRIDALEAFPLVYHPSREGLDETSSRTWSEIQRDAGLSSRLLPGQRFLSRTR